MSKAAISVRKFAAKTIGRLLCRERQRPPKAEYVYFQDEAEIGGQIIDIEQRRPL
jgi:hypothetical protein